MDTIILVHVNELGDLLFSLPAVTAVRRQFPGAHLVSVARPALAPLLQATGAIDRVIPRGPFLDTVMAVRRARPGTAVLFSESPALLLTAACAGIPRRIGFSSAALAVLLTETVPRVGVPSLDNARRLGEHLGVADIRADYTGLLPVPPAARASAAAWIARAGVPADRLVALSPGASRRRQGKRWPDGAWVALADRLAAEGYAPVFIGAPDEAPGLNALAARAVHPAAVFCAEEGILSLAALLAEAGLFVGIDSGAMHLAACVGARVVALFAGTDPAQVGPRPLNAHRVIRAPSMAAITVEDVARAAIAALHAPRKGHA